ncbi:MAG: hypothetical protein JSW70_04320 [Syntrophobacterales bacterium]|nr:MAG: hypothetical protein JSW70_04320 [Syntrophobacterales bacterium]
MSNAEEFLVWFALIGMLAFSPADFYVDLGIAFSLFADDIAHGFTSPNILYLYYYLSLNMPVVKGKINFFIKKIFKFKEVKIIKLNYFCFFYVVG